MFWRILFVWTIAGAVIEAATYFLIGVYTAWKEEKEGVVIGEDRFDEFLVDHTSWANWLFRKFSDPVAWCIRTGWECVVWPFEVPYVIMKYKRFISEHLPNDVNKAS